MSDDLISRKAVIALIDELGYINVHNHDEFKANCRVDRIRQAVIELPTAFDKEKVKEELISGKFITADGDTIGKSVYIRIDRAVEIVEKGGIE